MLQQTQTDRVVEKYVRFMRRFPTVGSLARATPRAVLREWQGLGYNRRALHLRACAQAIVRSYDGVVPQTMDALTTLPGIGHYTAGAIRAFAFNLPEVIIETNIRSVFLHSFFPMQNTVRDDRLLPLIEQTLDRKEPRRWYSALMDYGAWLKRQVPNPSRASAHHTRQSTFEGSTRQIRGATLSFLLTTTSASLDECAAVAGTTATKVRTVLDGLVREGMVRKVGVRYAIT